MVRAAFLFQLFFFFIMPIQLNGVNAKPIKSSGEPDYEQISLTFAIQSHLDTLYRQLKAYNKKCHSYPKTHEGFVPLELLGRELNCPKQAKIEAAIKEKRFPQELDPLKKPYKYVSDGKTFKIEGSLGYSVSDHTVNRGEGHWDNAHPLPLPSPHGNNLPDDVVE